MAGISTGVSLLSVETERLIDRLVDFFEFSGGSVVSAKGATTSNTNNATTLIGVDGTSNSSLNVTTTGNIDLGMITSSDYGFTLVAFQGNSANWGVFWGSYGNSLSPENYRAGYDPTTNRIRKKDSGSASTSFTLPSITLPAASNGFNFLCFSIKTNIYPSQTFKVFDASGGSLLSSTQNFGMIDSTGRVFTNDWVGNGIGQNRLDKVAVFNGELTSAEIAFLYNSGNGRTYTEIQNYTL